jgi:hypothetical protein
MLNKAKHEGNTGQTRGNSEENISYTKYRGPPEMGLLRGTGVIIKNCDQA